MVLTELTASPETQQPPRQYSGVEAMREEAHEAADTRGGVRRHF